MNKFPIFFESILYLNGEIPFLNYHYERIINLANSLNCSFQLDKQELETKLKANISESSQIYKIRVEFEDQSHILSINTIEIFPLNPTEINSSNPISICIFDHIKPEFSLSHFKIKSDTIYKDSIVYAKSRNCEQSILLNTNSEIVETSFCNIFFIKNNQIFTPKINSGAVSGVMRRIIFERYTVIEKSIFRNDISDYKEVFLTNAVKGIVLVGQIENQKYICDLSDKLRRELSENFHE